MPIQTEGGPKSVTQEERSLTSTQSTSILFPVINGDHKFSQSFIRQKKRGGEEFGGGGGSMSDLGK